MIKQAILYTLSIACATGVSNAQFGVNWNQIINTPFKSGIGAPANPCHRTGDLYTDLVGAAEYFCPSAGQTWVVLNATSGITQLTGDVTAGPGSGSQAATLAIVNGGPGACGDALHSCVPTTNGKGLVTSQTTAVIAGIGTMIFPYLPPYNCAGDGTTDDATCMASAYNAAANKVLWIDRTYAIKGISNWTASNVIVKGPGTFKIMAGAASSAYINLAGTTGSSTTSTTTISFANRNKSTARVIGVASAAGISAGTILYFQYCDVWPACNGSYIYNQVAKVISVSGTNLTMADPIIIPLDPAQTNDITILTPVSGVTIEDVTFDGSSGSGTAINQHGIICHYCVETLFQNVHITGFNQVGNSSGIYALVGRGNRWANILASNCGSANIDCLAIYSQSNFEAINLVFSGQGEQAASGEFAVGVHESATGHIVNVTAVGTHGRGFKLQNSTGVVAENISSNGSTANCTLAVFNGNYNNTLRNLTASGSTGALGGGFCMFGGNGVNSFNLIDGGQFHNNQGQNFQMDQLATDNDFYNINADNILLYNGPGSLRNNFLNVRIGSGGLSDTSASVTNRFILAGGDLTATTIACNGVASPAATLWLLVSGASTCTDTSGSVLTYIRVANAGYVQNLHGSATAGGVNASSGVVAIYDGGNPTGITCTFGTGTTCTDTTNRFLAAAGDILQVRMTTQGGETLNNVSLSYEHP